MMDQELRDMTDDELRLWLEQYAGVQAGYYPKARKQRVRAEAEARARGLAWSHNARVQWQPPGTLDGLRGGPRVRRVSP